MRDITNVDISISRDKTLTDDMESCIDDIKINPSKENLETLKRYLNRFFEKTSVCSSIIYTSNIDKLFFGIYVLPSIRVTDIYYTNENTQTIEPSKLIPDIHRILQYSVEFDSRLFGDDLGLTSGEILSFLLHDIGTLVNDNSPVKEIVKVIDKYCIENNKDLILGLGPKDRLLSFGIQSSLQKLTSIFEKSNVSEIHTKSNQITSDYFKEIYGPYYLENLIDGFNKIERAGFNYNKEVTNKFLTLSWTLRNFFNFKESIIAVLHTLAKWRTLTPSKLERVTINLLISDIGDKIHKEFREMDLVLESSKLYGKLSIDLSKYKDKLNLLDLKMQNSDDYEEDEVTDIITSINMDMGMIHGYCNTHPESISPIEHKQWDDMYIKLNKMRKNLYKNASYYYKDYKIYNQWNKQSIQ